MSRATQTDLRLLGTPAAIGDRQTIAVNAPLAAGERKVRPEQIVIRNRRQGSASGRQTSAKRGMEPERSERSRLRLPSLPPGSVGIEIAHERSWGFTPGYDVAALQAAGDCGYGKNEEKPTKRFD